MTTRLGLASTPALLALGLALAACAPVVERPGAAIGPPVLAEAAYRAADGAELPIQRWLPNPSAPRAVVLALHGMNDYANAFAMPGPWWAQRGIATYAYDQRGFGRAPHPGRWAGTEALVDDLDAMVALLGQRYPRTPIYLVGNSMGGAVAMAALARAGHPQVAGVILAAPAVWGRATMDVGKRVLLFLAAHTMPWHRVTGEGLNVVPSDNREMLLALARDPLVIKDTRLDTIWGLVNLMDDAFDSAPRLDDVPLLILYGEHDEIIPKGPTRRMIEMLPRDPRAPRTIAIYAKGYHMLLQDLEAEIVWRDVLAWIEDPKAPLPSGADKVGLEAIQGP